MKRALLCFFIFLFLGFSKNLDAQVFWTENFGTGCTQGNLAAGAAPTGSNGAWAVTPLTAPFANGTNPNEWFISATEAGVGVGVCGDGCLASAGLVNRTLHIGSNVGAPLTDPGAAYLAGAPNFNTNKRVESPVINCTGNNNIVLSFNYIQEGITNVDFAELMYSANGGAAWSSLGNVPQSNNTGCAGQGLWTAFSVALPASANNNPNVKIGFRWQSNDPAGADPSIAVDDITLSKLPLSFTVPASACVNQTVQATVAGTVASTASYSWSSAPAGGVFAPATSSAPAVSFPTGGTYTITCYALDAANVVLGTSTQTITIASSLAFTLTPSPSTICIGQSATITATGALNYTWSPGATLSSTSGSVVVATPVSLPATYTVNADNGAGCSGTKTVTINSGAAPPISVIATSSAVCAGFISTLTASGATSYTWTGSSFTAAVSQASVGVGPGTYTLQASNGSACISQTVITIGTAPPLAVTISQNQYTTCIAQNYPPFSKPVQLTANGASTYNWFPCDQYISICVGSVVQVRPPTSTCYTVTGNTPICTGSAVICVTVVPQFTIDVVPKQPIMCIGDSMQLKVANIGTLGVAPFTYSWTEPPTTPPIITITNPLQGTVTVFPTNTLSPTVYTTEVFDSRGCVSLPRLVTVTVLPQPTSAIAIPTIAGVPTNTVCFVGNITGVPDVTLTLTANNTNSGLPPGVVPTHSWYPPYYTPTSPILTPSATVTSPSSVIVSAPARTPTLMTYTVVSGYNGIDGCIARDTVTVRVVDCRSVTAISFTTATPNDTICSRTCVTFINYSDTLSGGPQTYTWVFSGGSPATSTLQSPTICYNLPGKFNVILKVCNPYPVTGPTTGSCYQKGFLNYIKVVDIPNPKIMPFQSAPPKDTTIRFGQCITMTATNAASYVWYPNYNLSNTTGSIVTACPKQTTQYILQGFNSKGCWYNDTVTVHVVEDCGNMFVPNAFSPNNDGVNDILYVRGYCLETMTFMVFDRWGEKVFETSDQKKGWDGMFKGELMNTGVFVYRLEGKTFEGKGFSQKGNITLVR